MDLLANLITVVICLALLLFVFVPLLVYVVLIPLGISPSTIPGLSLL